ncbi:hypothetical protein MUN89_01780 [Halobacillus salinarum]|uniref:Uncharacterized protein n=1 Tax=Halobacillus salinarum TaxID=2932257 RepID=A0ABY4EKM8_9BACI|nr:hypothetical protein [Halobacillus salinarum]UOQ44719.1 hypothetical protein MUN89_01780 [Halobacillus salinarum]
MTRSRNGSKKLLRKFMAGMLMAGLILFILFCLIAVYLVVADYFHSEEQAATHEKRSLQSSLVYNDQVDGTNLTIYRLSSPNSGYLSCKANNLSHTNRYLVKMS